MVESASPEHPVSSCDVLIVGAGAAGLAAARVLGSAGRRVIMLEARDRAGGRAHSVDAPGESRPVELGPEFVHGHPEVTLRRLRAHGLGWMDASSGAWRHDGDQLVEDDGDDDRPEALVRRALAALAPGEDRDVLSAVRAVATAEEDEVVETVLGMVRGFDAADPSRAGLRAVAEEWAGDASLATASARIAAGYRGLWRAELFALSGLPVALRCGHCVEQIAYGEQGVRIVATTPTGKRCAVEAAHAIVTVPLGVLQADDATPGTMRWEPPLPAATREALGGLAMGPVVKAMLLFDDPFWERLEGGRYIDAAFFRAPRGAPFRTLWTTLPHRSAVLTAWAGGSDVQAPVNGGEAAVVAAVFATIAATFGAAAAAEAERSLRWACTHDWQRDPFARGAYSYVLAGGGGARDTLREPLAGRVYLAGEALATGGEGGTVAGALMSGEEAAGRLLRVGRDVSP